MIRADGVSKFPLQADGLGEGSVDNPVDICEKAFDRRHELDFADMQTVFRSVVSS